MRYTTPGPWHMYELHPGIEINAETRDGIAMVNLDDTDEDALAETEANARLIAAAPDLLEACKSLLSSRQESDEEMAAFKAMRAAVAKAEEDEVVVEFREQLKPILARMERKMLHGCSDMNCKECDR